MAIALPEVGMTAKAEPTSWKGFFFFFHCHCLFSSFLLRILLGEKSAVSYHHDTSLCFSLPAKMLGVPSETTALCRTYREVQRPRGHFCLLLFRLLKSFGPTFQSVKEAQG